MEYGGRFSYETLVMNELKMLQNYERYLKYYYQNVLHKVVSER